MSFVEIKQPFLVKLGPHCDFNFPWFFQVLRLSETFRPEIPLDKDSFLLSLPRGSMCCAVLSLV